MKHSSETIFLVLVLVALAVPVLRYAVSFQAAEPALDAYGLRVDVSPLTGLAFGLSFEGAAFLGVRAAFAARRRSLRSWWWPLAGALVQTVAGTGMQVPVLVAQLRGVALPVLLGALGSWLWCAVMASATLLTFATVALALAVQPQKRADADRNTSSVEQVKVELSAHAQHAPVVCGQCGRTFASVPARSAHMRFCKAHGAGKEHDADNS